MRQIDPRTFDARDLHSPAAVAAAWIVQQVRHDKATPDLERLSDLDVLRQAVEHQVLDMIRLLRGHGATWATIGDALGMDWRTARRVYGDR